MKVSSYPLLTLSSTQVYSPHHFLYISYCAHQENLFNNQDLRNLVITSSIIITFMFQKKKKKRVALIFSVDIAADFYDIAIPKFNTKVIFFKVEDGAVQSAQKNEKTVIV